MADAPGLHEAGVQDCVHIPDPVGAIFSNQETIVIEGIKYRMERTPGAKLRFFNIEGYSFLEQNPKKSSHWAKLAREGSLIMWVMKGRRYLGQVRDGVFHDLKKK